MFISTFKPLISAIASFVVLLAVSLSIILLAHRSTTLSEEKNAVTKLNTIEQLIENQLESKKQIADIFAGFMSDKDSINETEFKNFAQYIMVGKNDSNICLQWAPKGIIQYAYPYAGNEESIHLNLFEYPTTKISIQQSFRSKLPHINGPIPLVQGGIGVVYRVPVYSIHSKNRKFLGFSAIVIKWNSIIEKCALNKIDSAHVALKFSESAQEKRFFDQGIFYGYSDFFNSNDKIFKDTLEFSDKKWILAVKVKKNAWASYANILYIFLSVIFCAIIAFFTYKNSRYIEMIKIKNTLLHEKNTEIQKQINEKILLLREVHHRVKNNFQLVSSLARLQSYELDDPKSKGIFEEFGNRISTIALTHEQLLRDSNNTNHTSIKEYIESLCDNLIDKSIQKEIAITVDVLDETFPIKYVILLGIVINELITNSVKYAFEKKIGGKIYISLKKNQNKYELSYLDDGKGLKKDLLTLKKDSFGIELIKSISEQIDGQIEQVEIDNKSGFIITFQMQEEKS